LLAYWTSDSLVVIIKEYELDFLTIVAATSIEAQGAFGGDLLKPLLFLHICSDSKV